jgi:putative acetyltransferase
MIEIRIERAEDAAEVRAINEQAFGQPTEADIVDRLREACPDCLSLVAEEDGRVVGHILFSPATIETASGADRTSGGASEAPGGTIEGMGLAPMAVLPDRQRQGVGSTLVRRGLEILRKRRCPFVIVLGHPNYYPRFGFEVASKHGLRSQWDGVPDEAFMVLVMHNDIVGRTSGTARYRAEFNEAV